MRILFVQRHFWPDVPTYAHISKQIASQLAADGHEVTVLSAMPSYNGAYVGPDPPRSESIDGIDIIRLGMTDEHFERPLLRNLDTLLFLLRVLSHLVRRRRAYDVVVVTNAPPIFLAAVVRRIAPITGLPYVYHCQDLQPEAAVIAGQVSRRWVAQKLLQIDRKNCEEATAVIILSQDMRTTLTSRGVPDRNLRTINNFIINSSDGQPAAPSLLPDLPHDTYRVIFAGNMGRFQGLDRVVEASHLLSDRPEIQFIFMGSGVELNTLKEQASSNASSNISFIEHQPIANATRVLNQCDLAIVSLRSDMYRVAYPSKVMAYLEAGCELLLLLECTSEIARTLESLGVGHCCDDRDPRAIADAVLKEYRQHSETGLDREKVRSAGRNLFSAQAVLPKWTALFKDIECSTIDTDESRRPMPDVGNNLCTRKATVEDVPAVVQVHMAAFPSSTMTRLGPRFLKKYYAIVLANPDHLFLVAEDQHGGVIGFAAGFIDPRQFYRGFSNRRPTLVWTALPAFARHPSLILDARRGSDWANGQVAIDVTSACELASIGILPGWHGNGFGSSLVTRFAQAAFSSGASEVMVTTDARDNNNVRRFYDRLGFEATEEFHRGKNRPMVVYRLYRDASNA